MLKIGGRKINYFDFVSAHSDPGLAEALKRLLPRIFDLDFGQLICETPYMSELQGDFLKTYLEARRDRIFRPLFHL